MCDLDPQIKLELGKTVIFWNSRQIVIWLSKKYICYKQLRSEGVNKFINHENASRVQYRNLLF